MYIYRLWHVYIYTHVGIYIHVCMCIYIYIYTECSDTMDRIDTVSCVFKQLLSWASQSQPYLPSCQRDCGHVSPDRRKRSGPRLCYQWAWPTGTSREVPWCCTAVGCEDLLLFGWVVSSWWVANIIKHSTSFNFTLLGVWWWNQKLWSLRCTM